jgi:hypothetical protein
MNLVRPDAPRFARLAPVSLLVLLTLVCGCPLPQAQTPIDGADPNQPVQQSGVTSINNPGGSITAATALDLADGDFSLTSRIRGGSDVDVYNIGSLDPGDRLIIDVRRQTGDLDPVAAVFDGASEMIAFNDDRVPDASDLNPYIDFVVRGTTRTYYLAIIGYPGENTAGEYQADIRIQRGVGLPDPVVQLVYLEWRGGRNITVANVGTFDLPAFSAVDVGLPAAQTLQLKDRVAQIVRERYTGYNLTVLSSDHDAVPTTPHSTVYFGGTDQNAFAISEQIDSYNQDPSDDTIVFTGSYRDAFSHDPSLEEMAQALGNTVAHEVGHLVGLIHTADCADLMDTSCANDRILAQQNFKTGRIDSSVFPFGVQNAPELLDWVLGLIGMGG